MRVRGSATAPGDREHVFDRLLDPDVLARCIPGCESLEKQSEDKYVVTVTAGVGAVKGTFKGDVEISKIERPECYTMTIGGKSPVGHARGQIGLVLEVDEDGATRIEYDGEIKVSGMIAAVGQRLLGAAARKLTGEFFTNLQTEFEGS